jgi:transaldolase
MKIFIDSANLDEIKKAKAMGLVDGVTTNPSLVAKEGRDFREVINEITTLVDGPISAEVISTDSAGMIKEGRDIAKWHKNIVVKVPMTIEGLKAVSHFSKKKIKTNVTLVFSVAQAILAAKAGATIISPFIGRLDDQGEDGMRLIEEIMDVWDNSRFETEVLVASTRHPRHIVDAARTGAHICTIPADVFRKLPNHSLTTSGLKKFMEDWEKVKK